MTIDLSLHVISELNVERGIDHLDVARAAVAGGAGVFQLRVKDVPLPDIERIAGEAVALCRGTGTACIINDYPDIAARVGAYGTHVGREDTPLEEALHLSLARGLMVGASASNLEGARAAEAAGAHYVGLGPIFATPSKADASPPIGLDGLAHICSQTNLPIVAIGGITLENVRTVVDHGAAGVAVISAITHSPDMIEAVREIRRGIDGALPREPQETHHERT